MAPKIRDVSSDCDGNDIERFLLGRNPEGTSQAGRICLAGQGSFELQYGTNTLESDLDGAARELLEETCLTLPSTSTVEPEVVTLGASQTKVYRVVFVNSTRADVDVATDDAARRRHGAGLDPIQQFWALYPSVLVCDTMLAGVTLTE